MDRRLGRRIRRRNSEGYQMKVFKPTVKKPPHSAQPISNLKKPKVLLKFKLHLAKMILPIPSLKQIWISYLSLIHLLKELKKWKEFSCL